MAFDRPSLSALNGRIYQDYATRFRPLDKSPRFNLIQVLSRVDAGKYHQLYGDLAFLSKQIFPDSAEAEYLRAHWSDRVPPNYAVTAVGKVRFTGANGVSIPVGLLLSSQSGQVYYVDTQGAIAGGAVAVTVKAQTPGAAGNLAATVELNITSAVPPGVSPTATVAPDGITGGIDAETDEAYLTRVLLYIRNGARYGKPGDFAAWAVDASAEVSQAFEIKNFGPLGALLIQVIGGNQIDGVIAVGNLAVVEAYIAAVAPPIIFTVKTPALIAINPSIHLLPAEDTVSNRLLLEERLRTYLQFNARPGCTITAGGLRDAIVDGVLITAATVAIEGGGLATTVLQLPILGAITWT